MLSSYGADIPKAEDLLGIKRVSRTMTSCYICELKNNKFSFYTDCSQKHFHRRNFFYLTFLGTNKRSAAEDTLAKPVVFFLLPVPHTLSFIGLHPSVDIPSIYTFEPMNTLSLGICRLWKDFLYSTSMIVTEHQSQCQQKTVLSRPSEKSKISRLLPS